MESWIIFLGLVFLNLFAYSKADPNTYAPLNWATFEAHNKARTNPEYYAQLAKNELENKFVYDRNNQPTKTMCLAKDFIPKSNICYFTLSTNEGPSAWKEATQVLTSGKYGKPKALQWSEGLAQACYDHIRDQGPKGASGHDGSDGSTPHDRILRYVTASMTGENLAYSDADNGEDVVLQLLVDDGVPNRGHRDNIMEQGFTHVGVSCGCHQYYTEMCCFAYGKGVKEKNPSKKADVAPQLKTCTAYSTNTRSTGSGNFHVSSTTSTPTTTPSQPATTSTPEKPQNKPASQTKIPEPTPASPTAKPSKNNSKSKKNNRGKSKKDDEIIWAPYTSADTLESLFPSLFNNDDVEIYYTDSDGISWTDTLNNSGNNGNNGYNAASDYSWVRNNNQWSQPKHSNNGWEYTWEWADWR